MSYSSENFQTVIDFSNLEIGASLKEGIGIEVLPKFYLNSIYWEDYDPYLYANIEAKASFEKFKKNRLLVVNYFEMELENGDIFTYELDQNITCTVKNQRKVEYQGEGYYLSGLTQKLMNTDSRIRGSKYWYHKGRNLVEIYNATYAKD